MYKAKVTQEGLMIPADVLRGLSDVLIVRKRDTVLIRPAESVTRKTFGTVHTSIDIDQVMDSYPRYLAGEVG